MTARIGLLLLSRISRRPVAHLLNCVKHAGPPVGAQPRNAGGSGVIDIDLQPMEWILSPVRISAVIEP